MTPKKRDIIRTNNMPGHTRKTEKKKKPAKKPAASNGYTLSKRKTKTRTRRA